MVSATVSEPFVLDFDAPPADPVPVLEAWLGDARQTDLPNPNAMTLSTIDERGAPTARVVLLKGLDARGAVFYTNRESAKGRAIDANPLVSLSFHWDPLTRQASIRGRATRVDDAESDAYFASRPRGSQLSAWASHQSQPVADRAALDAAWAEVEARFDGVTVPRPPHWGGYRVSLDRLEFWQGHPLRLHDRIVYVAGDGAWAVQRLQP